MNSNYRISFHSEFFGRFFAVIVSHRQAIGRRARICRFSVELAGVLLTGYQYLFSSYFSCLNLYFLLTNSGIHSVRKQVKISRLFSV